MRIRVGLALVIVSLFVIVSAVPAFSQGYGGGNTPGSGYMSHSMPQRGPVCTSRTFAPPPPEWAVRVGKEIGLTDEQQTKGKELIKNLIDKIKTIQGDNAANKALIDEMKANPTDPAKVQKLAEAAMKVEQSVLEEELKTWMEFEKMVPADQQTKFWNMLIRTPPPPPPPGAPPVVGPPPVPTQPGTPAPPPGQ